MQANTERSKRKREDETVEEACENRSVKIAPVGEKAGQKSMRTREDETVEEACKNRSVKIAPVGEKA
eukprot:860791-Karenia_brevis.AAC.1